LQSNGKRRINMDMDQAAVFLAGSILTMMGFIVVVIGLVIINNIINKYWKPIRVFTSDSWTAMNPPERFMQESQIEPKIEEIGKTKS
jgi:hypothetical protein